MYIPGIVAVADVFEERRSLALGITVSASGWGQVVKSLVNQGLFEDSSWAFTSQVMCFLCMGSALLALLLPEKKRNRSERGSAESETVYHPQVCGWLLGCSFKARHHIFVMVLYSLGDLLSVLALYLPYSCLPELSKQATLLIGTISVGSGIGRILSGWLCNRPQVDPFLLPPIAAAVSSIALLFLLISSNIYLLAFLCFTLGLTTGAWISSTSPLQVELVGLSQVICSSSKHEQFATQI